MKAWCNGLVMLVFGLVAIEFGSGSVQAAFITNGGFATGDFTGWTVTPASDLGTNAIVGNNPTFVHDGDGFSSFFQHSSTGPITLSQTITGLSAGQHYTLDFYFKDGGNPDPPTAEFKVSWAGSAVLDILNFNSRNVWQHETIDVVAPSASASLAFLMNENVQSFLVIDQITLVGAAPTNSVPEPTSVALWATLAAVAGLSSRAKSRRTLRGKAGERRW